MKAEATNGTTTLEQLLQGGAPVTPADAIPILRSCAARLDVLAKHGRLTPARIQLDAASEIHIDADDAGPLLDATDQALPAPQHAAYLSPEEVLGTPTDSRSSEFSLAVIAYEMLTGRKPFRDTNLSALIYEICAAAPEPADTANPRLNAATAEVLARALAKDPGQRFPSCGIFVDALQSAVRKPAPPAASFAPLPIQQVAEQPPAAAVPDLPAARRRRSFDTEQPAGVPVPAEQPRRSSNLIRMAVVAVLAAFLLVFLIDRHPSPGIPQQTIDPRVGPVGPPPPPEDGAEDEATTGTAAPSSQPQREKQNRAAQPTRKPPATAAHGYATPANGERTDAARANGARTDAARADAWRSGSQPAYGRSAAARSPLSNSNAAPQLANSPLAGAGSAAVELLTEPPGALVTVDGRSGKSCTAPCTLLLPGGRHVLTAQLQGYSVAQRIFNTPETSSLIIALGANMGTLIVNSSPAGATISVDGREAGRSPVTLHLSAGQHRLEALAGGQVQEQTVNIQADSIQGATFNLR